MSDRAASPPRARGGSPPSRPKTRNDDRSQSPPRNSDNRGRRDDYRSRGNDDDRPSDSREQWRDRRSRDEDRSYRRHDDRDDGQSHRRDRNRDSDERPDRDRPRPKKTFGGIKYKEKRRDDDDGRDDNDRRGGSYRGYRNRSPSPRRRRGYDRDEPSSTSTKKGKKKSAETDTSKPPARAPAASVASGEEMIIVHVNDRLGTKAAIPCFASDRIKEFKIMVAARIGREPHEILLKRQGQRPFKDILTLADYEISNGVQLDLEVDTGD
ncbi:ubiquitin-related domain-containing protein [Xylaria arbuscula]|nr:ubiquitin-related domain-containing protein [Xylaria arbuscula]